MGLFDKLKKQDCEICGKEVGLFGYKKLEDGEICKDCVKLLSPWFSERRHSTVESIKAQIAYREENKKAVAAFKASKVIGKTTKVHIDEAAGKFMVARTDDLENENPDVIDISAVTGCEMDIRETAQEVYRTVNGKNESYMPPRFKYLYDFDMLITVNHPYFDEIRYNLSPFNVVVDPNAGLGLMSRSINPRSNREYMMYENMGEEIRSALLNYRSAAPAVPAAAPRFCPECGAATQGGKFCPECGNKLF